MFNIGMGELVFIILLALVVVGPERLPKIMREFGRIVRQVRLLVNEFTSQFGDELQSIQELQQPIQELRQLANDIDPVKQVTKIAVGLDANAGGNAQPRARTADALNPPASPKALVKPTAAFKSPPTTETNPIKIIARAQKANVQPPASALGDDS
jgi:sec-independent protein translocase protein TatB